MAAKRRRASDIRREQDQMEEDALALLRESACGHADEVKKLLERRKGVAGVYGVDRDVRDDKTGRSPLHKAACHGHLACIKLLLEYGGNPGGRDFERATPLHLAAMNAHADCCKYLLQACGEKCDPDARTGLPDGSQTALHYLVLMARGEEDRDDCRRRVATVRALLFPPRVYRNKPASPQASGATALHGFRSHVMADFDTLTMHPLKALSTIHVGVQQQPRSEQDRDPRFNLTASARQASVAREASAALARASPRKAPRIFPPFETRRGPPADARFRRGMYPGPTTPDVLMQAKKALFGRPKKGGKKKSRKEQLAEEDLDFCFAWLPLNPVGRNREGKTAFDLAMDLGQRSLARVLAAAARDRKSVAARRLERATLKKQLKEEEEVRKAKAEADRARKRLLAGLSTGDDDAFKEKEGTEVTEAMGTGKGKNAAPCVAFQQGRCRRGDKCAFSHELGGAGGGMSAKQRQFLGVTKRRLMLQQVREEKKRKAEAKIKAREDALQAQIDEARASLATREAEVERLQQMNRHLEHSAEIARRRAAAATKAAAAGGGAGGVASASGLVLAAGASLTVDESGATVYRYTTPARRAWAAAEGGDTTLSWKMREWNTAVESAMELGSGSPQRVVRVAVDTTPSALFEDGEEPDEAAAADKEAAAGVAAAGGAGGGSGGDAAPTPTRRDYYALSPAKKIGITRDEYNSLCNSYFQMGM